MSDFRPQPGFRRRLGYYLVGLSIGFGMLGMIWWAKANFARAQPQPTPAAPAAPTGTQPPPPQPSPPPAPAPGP